MKHLRPVLWSALLSLAPALGATTPAPYVWTGLGTGWKGQVTPDLTAGTATLWLQDSIRSHLDLPATADISSVKLLDNSEFTIRSSTSGSTLTLRNGLFLDSSAYSGRLVLESSVTLNLPTAQTIDLGSYGDLQIFGGLTGTGNVTVTGFVPTLRLANLTGTPSTYSGTLTLSSTTNSVAPLLVLWNGNSLGSGSLVFTNGARLSVHGGSFNNAITLNTAGNGTLSVTSQDAAVTLGGTITLANSATLRAPSTSSHYDYEGTESAKSLIAPGATRRNPLVVSGTITESGGARALHITGDSPIILTGTSSFTGGLNVGFAYGTTNSSSTAGAGGALVFGSLNAFPSSGTIQSGYYDTSLTTQKNNSGYVGVAASLITANSTPFSQFANAISATSTGAVGIDTLPGETVTPYAGAIDLTHFTTTSPTGIRLGTATKATLTGTITPQKNTYAFGNGGGTLTVRTNLTDTPVTAATRNLNLFSNGGTPLGLYLQGTNSYSGGTFVGTGYLVFDGNGALTNSIPLLGNLTAGGSSTTIGASYIGYTDQVASNVVATVASAIGATEFLAKFDKTNTWGVVGFDSTNSAAPVSISNLDLSTFNDGVFVGTVSSAILKGTLTPTAVTNSNNPANTLRLTAGVGGTLTVQSQLKDLASGATPLQVIVGSPNTETLANGTVLFDPRNADNISAANTYSGGTYVNNIGSITLAAARNDAFGTGAITLQPQGGAVGLQAAAGGLVFGNNIVFANPGSQSTDITATLAPTGSNDFTLSGSLSGSGTLKLASPSNSIPLNLTLAGDNSAFNGTFSLQNGTLTLTHNNAAGQAIVELSADATLALGGSATSMTLYGLKADHGSIVLPDATNLTLNLDIPKLDHDFGGTITGFDGTATTASLTVSSTSSTANGTQLAYLYGNNRYSGGTTIVGDGAALALGHNNAAGTGLVTVNVTNGGLVLNTGITFTNRLQFTKGALAGFGTFAPTEINGDASATRRFTIGTGQMVIPGFPGNNDGLPGTLTLANSVTFTAGGTLLWLLQDPFRSDGYSALAINGDLDLTSLTSTSRFTIELETITKDGQQGLANLVIGDSYQFALLTASGSILGFDPKNFVIDTSSFQSNSLDPTRFALTTSSDGKQLLLSFTAVPEPSTYALFGLGLVAIAFAARRRRA